MPYVLRHPWKQVLVCGVLLTGEGDVYDLRAARYPYQGGSLILPFREFGSYNIHLVMSCNNTILPCFSNMELASIQHDKMGIYIYVNDVYKARNLNLMKVIKKKGQPSARSSHQCRVPEKGSLYAALISFCKAIQKEIKT